MEGMSDLINQLPPTVQAEIAKAMVARPEGGDMTRLLPVLKHLRGQLDLLIEKTEERLNANKKDSTSTDTDSGTRRIKRDRPKKP